MSGLLFLILLVMPVSGYFFKAFGLYSLAESRRINHPWLSWIPFINAWMLGCVSDQYRYVAQGESTRRRTWLLVLPILRIIAFLTAVVAGILCGVLESGSGSVPDQIFLLMLGLWAVLCLLQFVLEQVALHDLHRSCNPETAVLFLVLGIMIPWLQSVFIFVNRNSEQGMPPRVSKL